MSKRSLRAWFLKRDLVSVAAAFVGLIFGSWFLGPRNILPWNTDWLNRGDLAALQFSWEFFRQTPLIQWPLTAVPNYGVSFQNSLSFNTLVELPLKILRPILPLTFQYLGLWTVGCFVLQGYFGGKLLSLFLADKLQRFLAALIFVFSPALLFHIGVAEHLGLGVHGLILWAMYLYFRKRQSHVAWSTLIAIVLMTTPYISVMVIFIYLAAVGKTLLTDRDTRRIREVARLVFLPSLVGVLTFVVVGYLEYGDSAKGSGFFRLNAAAFFNPGFSAQDSFSFFLNRFGSLHTRQLLAEEGEGFQYLGLGTILTIPLLVVYMVRLRSATWWRTVVPLLSVCVFLFLVAMSNRIVLARHEFSYWLPGSILDLRYVFRAATRFSWPLYYLLTLAGVVAVVRLVRGVRIATILMLIVVSAHILDQLPGVIYAHRHLSASIPYRSPFVDPEWSDLAKTHTKINLFPNYDLNSGEGPPGSELWNGIWFHFARLAVGNRLSTNFALTGRPVTKYVESDNAKMTRELTSGNLEPGAIYVLSNVKTWSAARRHLRDGSRALVLDGYYVILGPPISD